MVGFAEPTDEFSRGPGEQFGKVSVTRKLIKARISKVDGEWVLIMLPRDLREETKRQEFWVRWRDGHNILVGCFLNNFFSRRGAN